MGAEVSSCLLCFEGEPAYEDSHRYTRFEDLQLDRELGHGAFSTVRLAINRQNKDKFAVKVVHKNKLKKADVDALHVEVGIISKLQHPHIVRYFDFTQDRSHYYIVLEVVAGGELFDRIVQRVYYSEKEARDLVWVLLDVLHHIHSKRIAHRDIKPENLLLKSAHNDHDIKLADFGFATEAKKPMRELCGTPAYVAPEIIKEKPYGLEVDMWSCGVIVFILLGGTFLPSSLVVTAFFRLVVVLVVAAFFRLVVVLVVPFCFVVAAGYWSSGGSGSIFGITAGTSSPSPDGPSASPGGRSGTGTSSGGLLGASSCGIEGVGGVGAVGGIGGVGGAGGIEGIG